MTKFNPLAPYNQLPDLPPTTEIETKKTLKKCAEARSVLGELKQASLNIPSQSVLINTLPLLEAQASSEIENVITTTDRLLQYSETMKENADPATKEAWQYGQALYQGYLSLQRRPLSTNTALEIVKTIKGIALDIRKTPGAALRNEKTGEVVYTPPVGEDLIRSKLSNWEQYLHESEDIDPLILMAIGHYQFEAIHPFSDGNGRTGRVLNILFLIEKKLLFLPVLYLSKSIIRNKSEYYRLLLSVTTTSSWEEWILFMLNSVHETAKWTLKKILAIRALLEHTGDFVKKSLPSIYSKDLVELIFENPYSRIQNVIEKDIAKRQTAARYLKELVRIGVLREMAKRKEKLFFHPKLVDLLLNDDSKFSTYSQKTTS